MALSSRNRRTCNCKRINVLTPSSNNCRVCATCLRNTAFQYHQGTQTIAHENPIELVRLMIPATLACNRLLRTRQNRREEYSHDEIPPTPSANPEDRRRKSVSDQKAHCLLQRCMRSNFKVYSDELLALHSSSRHLF